MGRDGKKKAAVATAHTILRIAYYVLANGQPYVEYGADFGSQTTAARERRLARELERLGYSVSKGGLTFAGVDGRAFVAKTWGDSVRVSSTEGVV